MFARRSPTVAAVDLPLRPEGLLAAWRAAERVLSLHLAPTPSLPVRLEARIAVVGLGAAATITGRVVKARRSDARLVIEVSPDATRMMALDHLLKVAASRTPVVYPPREERTLVTAPAVVLARSGPTFMFTVDVSRRGCALAWTAPLPLPGDRVGIRLGARNGDAAVVGRVRWVRPTGRAAVVGVHLEDGALDAWAGLHARLRASGAPFT